MKRLIIFALLITLAGCSREQPPDVINNLRQVDWAMEQDEAMVVTNFGGLPSGGQSDFMVVKDNRQQRYSAYISVTGAWIHVLYPGWLKCGPPLGREGEFMFPQQNPDGTPVARAMYAGGETITHVFTNGIWRESNNQVQSTTQ
jgi:hypothetical protein